jgi:two-component system, cell cycle sensor histidine kinase and response regulator CckA
MEPAKSNSAIESPKNPSHYKKILKTGVQKEQLFRLIFEQAVFGISILDRQGNFLDVNPAMARLLGYSRAEIQKISLAEISLPDDLADHLRLLNDLLSGKLGSHRANKRYLGREGQIIWADSIFSCENSLDGMPLVCLGMMEDITARQKTLDDLRQSEERYRLLAENISDVIWTKDLSGKITYISSSCQKLTGLSVEEVTGMRMEEVMTPASAPKYSQRMAEQLELENRSSDPARSWTIEYELLCKDGSTVWVESKISFLRHTHGDPIGTLEVTRDISERRQLEKQLFQAQKMEAIARLAGGIAHDFNNFLMVIMGYTDIILKDFPEGHPLQQYARDILLAAERASSLTRQLLAFSRRQVIKPEILNLNHLVTGLEKLLRRLIPEDIDMIVQLNPQLENIKADPGQIEQVLLNLVINARDALSQDGKIQILTDGVYLDQAYCQSHPGVEPGFYAKLTVSDNGAGMDQDTLERIFEPFFSTKEENKGTGLGLATVHGIIKQHHGYIAVSSHVGEGTAFNIYLPRILEPEKPIPAELLPEPQGQGTILLAEDENLLREVISKALQSYGFRVLEARDGKDGLQIGREFLGHLDLLLTDVVMPGMSGPELAACLRKLHPETKVAFMSGHNEDALIRHKILAGDVPFIQKPRRPLNLIRKVQEVLKSSEDG